MDYQQILAEIRAFMLEAGAMALRNQSSIKRLYKDGQQALTETDLAVSHMAQDVFKQWFDQPDHVLIDEESIDNAGTPDDAFARAAYQWVLDPIDGTAGYALGRNLWGISLGVMHNGVPKVGVIYLPAIQAMLLADDQHAWRIERVGTADETMTPLQPVELSLNSQTFIESYFGPNMQWGDGWYDKIWINRPESAVQGFYSALVGQSAGSVAIKNYSYWDVAGMAAIALRCGFQLKSIEDDRVFEKFTARDFQPSWKLQHNWMLSLPQHFDYLKSAVTGF